MCKYLKKGAWLSLDSSMKHICNEEINNNDDNSNYI
jgi:hypothetical protein